MYQRWIIGDKKSHPSKSTCPFELFHDGAILFLQVLTYITEWCNHRMSEFQRNKKNARIVITYNGIWSSNFFELVSHHYQCGTADILQYKRGRAYLIQILTMTSLIGILNRTIVLIYIYINGHITHINGVFLDIFSTLMFKDA